MKLLLLVSLTLYNPLSWGGGAPVVYEYALGHAENVDSIVVIEAALDGVEWRIPATIGNWTEQEYWDYVNNDLANRFQIFDIINGLGIPFGLVPPFYPSRYVQANTDKSGLYSSLSFLQSDLSFWSETEANEKE